MLKSFPTKPCRYCKGMGHWPYQCYKKPKKTTQELAVEGKYAKQWRVTRRTWYKKNLPIDEPYPHYVCYLCGIWLKPWGKAQGLDNPLPDYVTLDHVLPRSRHPELRFNQENLKPCCWNCNTAKGSKVLEVK